MLDLLKQYQLDRFIYTWSPSGFRKILSDRYDWFPQVYDIKPRMAKILEKENVALSDLSRKFFQSPICWRARLFSAHIRPSLLATNHRAIVLCIIHEAVKQLVHDEVLAEIIQEQATQEQLDVSGEVGAQEEEQQHDSRVFVADSAQDFQEENVQEVDQQDTREEVRHSHDRDRGETSGFDTRDPPHRKSSSNSHPPHNNSSKSYPRRLYFPKSHSRHAEAPKTHSRRDDAPSTSRRRPLSNRADTPEKRGRDSSRPSSRNSRSTPRHHSDEVFTPAQKRRRH